MADEKNFFAGLFDFSFQHQLTRRHCKAVVYSRHRSFGGITVVAKVVLGYQQFSRGRNNQLGRGNRSSLSLGFSSRECCFELSLVILRIAESIERSHPSAELTT